MTALVQSLNSIWKGDLKIDWVLVLIGVIPLIVLWLDPAQIIAFMTIALSALAQTSIYIAIAVGLLAYLKATGAETMVAEAFKGSPSRMIVVAALVGGLAPFCSCEVIPFIAALLALGAPLYAVMAFWLSSPLMDPPTFLITAAALGWEYAIAKGVAAVALGLFGGFALRAMMAGGAFSDPLRKVEQKGCCGCGPSPMSGKPIWRFWGEEQRVAVFRETAVTQGIFLLRWLAFAYMLEAALILYMPAETVASVVGGEGLSPIVISALVGMPAYLNGYVAPAMVAGLVEQGMQPGAAVAFLVAGAVSSIPAMAAVFSLVKREVFAVYLGLGVAGAVMSGFLFQIIVA
ncbi:MAG: permease [Pseudomonadota bacterium]